MAIIPIGSLDLITEFGANDTLLINTANGVKTIKASDVGGTSSADDTSYDNTTSGLTATSVQDAIDEIAQSGSSGGSGSSGSGSSADLVISINAGSIGTKTPTGISSFTSFTVSIGKSYDDVLAKARTGSLDIDGGLYWSYTDGGTPVSTCVRPIMVMSQEVYPAAALSQLGLSTQKDAIVITVNAGCYDYDSKDETMELIACMGEGAMRVIAEISNEIVVIDPVGS